jgi:DNA-directed RNA polymerase specialized sigma24 family protein
MNRGYPLLGRSARVNEDATVPDWVPTERVLRRAIKEARLSAEWRFRSRKGSGTVLEGSGLSAEDVAADALLDALVSFDPRRLRPDSSVDARFLGFVRLRVRNRFIDAVKSAAVRRRAGGEQLETTVSDDGSTEKVLLLKQYAWELTRTDPQARALVSAAVGLGLENRRDLAGVLVCPSGAVDAIRKRIRRRAAALARRLRLS